MHLILVRHAEAVNPSIAGGDRNRWLTTSGRATITRTVELMPDKHVTHIVTSPLVRAVQTAEHVANHCGYTQAIEVHRPLSEGSVGTVLEWPDAADDDATVALVGHEPIMSTLASHLLGHRFPGFPMAGILKCMYTPGRGGVFAWFVDPRGHCIHNLRDVRSF